jgi:hypothetical protein
LAIHVLDEALHDFLSLYNPIAANIKAAYPFIPIPTFTFSIWLTGLILAITALFGLSVLVFKGKRIMISLSYWFGVLMFTNGTAHIIGSFYIQKLIPGVHSAPLLLVFSIYLIVQAKKYRIDIIQ